MSTSPCPCRPSVALAAMIGVWAAMSSPVRAEGLRIEDVAGLHRACRVAEARSAEELYVVDFSPAQWRFAPYSHGEGMLPVDTRRNLRFLGGSAEVFPSRFEAIGFRASAERATELRSAKGATLRLGFFLGYDDPRRRACLIRPAVSVTTVRVDVAFVELLDAKGEVLARDDTSRLKRWRETTAASAIPGSGPRGAVDSASFADGRPVGDSIQRALEKAEGGELGGALGQCMAELVQRRGLREGRLLVGLRIDPGGRVAHASVSLSTLGDERGDRCVVDAFKGAFRVTEARRAGVFELSVPVRLVTD